MASWDGGARGAPFARHPRRDGAPSSAVCRTGQHGSPYRVDMPRVRFVRFSVLAGLAGLAVLTTLQAAPAPVAAPSADPHLASAWVPPNPTNAGKIFRWGNKQWGDEFVTPAVLDLEGEPARPGAQPARDAHPRHGHHRRDRLSRRTAGTTAPTVAGRPASAAASTARAASRTRSYWELVPSSQPYHCGAGNLVLSQYTLGTNTAEMHVRNLPNTRLHHEPVDVPQRQRVPHLRRRGHPRPHLLVRRHQGDPHRAAARGPRRRAR